MKLRKTLFLSLLILTVLCFISCATTVNVRMVRPAKLDLRGADTIAVLPFKPSDSKNIYKSDDAFSFFASLFFGVFEYSNPDEEKLLNDLHSSIEMGLSSSKYIKLIDSSAVKNALKTSRYNPAEVYLVGEDIDFSINDKHTVNKRKLTDDYYNEDGHLIKATYEIKDEYKRYVKMIFNYKLVNSSDNTILAYKNVTIEDSSSTYNSKNSLPSAYNILKNKIHDLAYDILKELQPYTVIKTITLMEDKTKNESFKAANELAKKGNINEAYSAFYDLYRTTNMKEAGYNAAMLQMARGNLSRAEEEMENLYIQYNDQKILSSLYDIQNEIKLSQRLKEQTEK